jgi:two-component system nitrogen regulation response regulator NtrX
MGKARILIVDDEENVAAVLRGVLEDEGFRVFTAASGEECLKSREGFDVILLDVWLPGKDGLEVLRELRTRDPNQYVVMISGHGTIETAVQATKLGAFDFIEKPLTTEKVVLVLEHALQQKALEEENRTLRDLIQRNHVMVGSSIPMQALRQQIRYAAPTEGRVLIYGDNGTGKELVARLLHLESQRKSKPFIDVNCAAIPEDLIESELFGTVKGAYTGATESRKGKFELADKATLFLDEIGDMSLKTQAKVLRVLDEQRFHPVGSPDAVEVDVRVIAATNKNLEEEIEKGSFREDLFFRLNVIPFEVPPLHERREDIPELVAYFEDLFCGRYGKGKHEIDADVMEKLRQYYWPGNVRELKNVIERLVIMVPSPEIRLIDLPAAILSYEPENDQSGLQAAKEKFERKFVLEKLLENDGNISRTAAAIGIERSHLHRKLKALRIKLK